MCGIAGIFNMQGQESMQASAVHRMADRMRHRGPDDEGYLLIGRDGSATPYYGADTPMETSGENKLPGYPKQPIQLSYDRLSMLALGHRRLSIIDLSAHGHQPMSADSGRYWMVYNGEIYNYQEVAKELRQAGIELHGHSDSEILINAYSKWGTECLKRLNGMFAFSIWDQREKVLFCARDRLGIKPFYYTIQDDLFIFASDIKTIIASGSYKPAVDRMGLYYAMVFGMAPRPMTAFRGVVALEQACWMKIHLGGHVEKGRYWSVPIGTQDHTMSEGDAVRLLEEELTASIKRRLVADVPVGTFMSGGIDSTTVSAIAARIHPGIKAFTLEYADTGPDQNETDEARATAVMHPMEHIVAVVSPEHIIQTIEERVLGYEEPAPGLAANYEISKIVRENNTKVVLNGLGGDELFAGYSWYSWIDRWRLMKKLRPVMAVMPKFFGRTGQRLASVSALESADRLHSYLFSKMNDDEAGALFKNFQAKNQNSIEALRNLYVRDLTFEDDIEAMSYMDVMNYIGNHHVHRIDQFTMVHSIEGRFPFLDYQLVEAAFSIPSKYKFRAGQQKYVLRQVARNHIAPVSLSMKKRGFSMPLRQWMRGALKSMVKDRLDRLCERSDIEQKTVIQWSKEYEEGQRIHAKLWHLVMLELWYEAFID